MEIAFEGVTVKTKTGKELLSNVTGIVSPGSFTSLMGSSGSGKTTLLSTLSRRFEASLFYNGNIRYNGRKWNARDRRAIAFVQQDDIMPTYLTVEDFLRFSAKLRLDVSDEAREERVERVIARLRLQKCRHTVIGGVEARGVSGGERKRTNIANELLTEPQVIFTDEPTSGLDSTLSNVVIDILKDLASDGLTVVTTIHSPSSSIFERFDNLIILDEGKVFYRGAAQNLVNYLNETLGRTVPANFNPADYLMDVLVLEKERPKDEKLLNAMASFTHLDSNSASSVSHDEPPEKVTGHRLAERRRTTMSMRGRQLVRNVSVIFRPGDLDAGQTEKKFARNFFVQVYLLTARLWKKHRKHIFTRNQIGSTIGLALISGFLYFQLGFSENEIFSRVSLSLWLVGTDMYLGVFSTSFALQDDIPLVKKELYDGSYSLGAHVLAKQLVAYPNSALWSLVFCIVVLGFSHLSPSVARAVLAILTVQAEVFLFQGVGFLISAAVPTSGLVTVVVVVVTYYFAFNGFFAPFRLMAEWYRWLRWPCFLQYSFQLIMQIVFSDPDTVYQCNVAPVPSAYPACANGSTVITGSDILEHYDVDLSPATCILVILLGGLGVRFLAYIFFKIRMTPPKGVGEERKGLRAWLCGGRKKVETPTADDNNKADDDTKKDEDAVQVV